MWICLECNNLFEDGEEARWSEPHGERMVGCPICRSGFTEAAVCIKCGSHYHLDRLWSGLCLECVADEMTIDNVMGFVHEHGRECDFYSAIFCSDIQECGAELGVALEGYLRKIVSMEILLGKETHLAQIREYLCSDVEVLREFATWIGGKYGNKK